MTPWLNQAISTISTPLYQRRWSERRRLTFQKALESRFTYSASSVRPQGHNDTPELNGEMTMPVPPVGSSRVDLDRNVSSVMARVILQIIRSYFSLRRLLPASLFVSLSTRSSRNGCFLCSEFISFFFGVVCIISYGQSVILAGEGLVTSGVTSWCRYG